MFKKLLMILVFVGYENYVQSMDLVTSKGKRKQPEDSIANLTDSRMESVAVVVTAGLKKQTEASNSSNFYYNSQRTRNLYDPAAREFKLSRSKLADYLACPTCFYTDRKLGIGTPPGYPFNLNSAVDELCKKEFDAYRASQQVHPLCLDAGIDAVPFAHPNIEKWRNSLSAGLQAKVPGTNIILQGGIDDVWQDRTTGKLIVVDYKATSKKGEVNLDASWQDGYKKQVEVYQYLLRRNGHDVSDTAYFVYANGRTDEPSFSDTLKFTTKLLPYKGNDAWVESAVVKAYQCLQSDTIPCDRESLALAAQCNMCRYFAARTKHVQKKSSIVDDGAREA